MKHLSKREDFLRRNKYSKLQNIINEEAGGPFTNDIPWGDSLVGRLINSFIRKAKIGYNSTKIKPLIESFKNQLDILISSSLNKDTLTQFNLLQLKALFHNIKQVCSNSTPEEQKLDELIGGHQDLWDQAQQNGGKWKDVLTGGLVPECYEYIENKMDKKQLEDSGIQRDKLLDEISIFIDNLRRLTDVSGSPAPLQQQSGFPQLFGNLVNRFSVINESFSNDFVSIILEGMSDEDLKSNVKKGEDDLAKMDKNDPGRKAMENELANAKRLLNKRLGNKNNTSNTTSNTSVARTGGLVTTDGQQNTNKGETGVSVVNKTETGLTTTDKRETGLVIGATGSNKQETGLVVVNDDTNAKIAKIKELALKCLPKKLDTTEKILKDTDAIGFIKAVGSLEQTDLDYLKRKNPKETFDGDINKLNTSKEVENIKEEPVKEQPKTKEPVKEQPKVEAQPEKVGETYRYDGYSIYEATGTQSSGTQSTATTQPVVIDCWNKFVTEGRIPAEMVNVTQREIDELERLTNENINGTLTIDLSVNSDPIISICRIFKRANDIYFTPVIPSGRSGGKVSNKTFLEYEKLGGASSGANEADNPGYGPWAVKKLRNTWTDGVLQILEDQKYRKVLANLRFIVPGSEDRFNKSESLIKKYDSFMKVFEAETTTDTPVGGQLGKDKKSHGQILFDFINDLLDNKTAANFDEQRRILLKKYFEPFGMKVVYIKDNTPAIIRQPECDPETIFWNTIDKFNKPNTTKYSGNFYAIPIVKTTIGNHDMIFVQLLKKVSIAGVSSRDFYYVKFVFDKQIMVDLYKKEKLDNYTITTDWSTTASLPRTVYYGIITNIGSNDMFSLFYANVANKNEPDEIYGFKENFKLFKGKKTGPNGEFSPCLSVLTFADAQKKLTTIETDFCKPVSNEFGLHEDNLKINSKDPNFGGALIDALKEKVKKEFQ